MKLGNVEDDTKHIVPQKQEDIAGKRKMNDEDRKENFEETLRAINVFDISAIKEKEETPREADSLVAKYAMYNVYLKEIKWP